MVSLKRRKCKTPQPIGKLISQFLKSRGLEKSVKEQVAILHWQEIVGEKIAEHAHAVEIRDGVLFLGVTNAVWRNQIFFFKEDIIKKVNSFAQKKIVHTIYFSA